MKLYRIQKTTKNIIYAIAKDEDEAQEIIDWDSDFAKTSYKITPVDLDNPRVPKHWLDAVPYNWGDGLSPNSKDIKTIRDFIEFYRELKQEKIDQEPFLPGVN